MAQHTPSMADAMQPQQQAAGQQAAPEAAGQPQAGQQQGGGDKQAMFEQLAGPKLEYIYGSGLEDVKRVLETGADNPSRAIGDLVGKLLASSAMNARDNGVSIPPDVMTATAQELTNNITDIAVKMGIVDQAQANDVGEEAFVSGIATFGQIAADNAISQAEKQQYAQIVGEMRQLMGMKGGQAPQDQQQPPQQQEEAAPAQQAQQQPASMAQAMG